MAPPVLSYFRGQHRRSGSSPSSPQANQLSHGHLPPHASQPWSQSPLSAPGTSASQRASPISPQPPVLPPIPRIASRREADGRHESDEREAQGDYTTSEGSIRSGKERRSPSLPVVSPAHSRRHGSMTDISPAVSEMRGPAGMRLWVPDFQPSFNVEPFDLQQPTQAAQEEYGVQSRWRQAARPASRDFSYRPLTPNTTSSQAGLDHSFIMPHAANRSSSPSSSFSSFHKAASSTNLTIESSPVSSSSANVGPSHQHASRPSKSRINLLNPVSLLMRRRTSQGLDATDEAALYGHRNLDVPAIGLPEDYDPRIKGKGVHDFSAPRTVVRNPSAEHASAQGVASNLQPSEAVAKEERPAQADVGGATSMEKEHSTAFTEDFADTENQAAVRRESLANPDFLARVSRHFNDPDQEPVVPNDSQYIDQPSTPQHAQRGSKDTIESSVHGSAGLDTVRTSSETNATALSKTSEAPGSPKRNSPPAENTRMKPLRSSSSQASRFSFQLQGERSLAQERALEDKAKARQAEAEAAVKSNRHSIDADSRLGEILDESDYPVDDDDDGSNYYEEDIPGLGDDIDDNLFASKGGLQDQYLPNKADNTLETPRPKGQVGSAYDEPVSSIASDDLHAPEDTSFYSISQKTPIPYKTDRSSTKQTQISDDMYFDDGIIGDIDATEGGAFDESLLDSPTEGKKRHTVGFGSHLAAGNNCRPRGLFDHVAQDSHPLVQEQHPVQTDLDAYHSALATAATKAAAEGKFTRKSSIDSSLSPTATFPRRPHDDFETLDDDLYGLSIGDSVDDDNDDIDEDDMIAAANAEALAADNSGFYGSEFGIEVKRSASYKNAVKEPNLTPITERSEFSTRNSFISVGGALPTHGPLSGQRDGLVSSPALKDLMGEDDDEDTMSLSQLMKLRKEAFGASNRSSWANSSNTSSPVSHVPYSPLAPVVGPLPAMRSSFSEQEEDAYLSGGSDHDRDSSHQSTKRSQRPAENSTSWRGTTSPSSRPEASSASARQTFEPSHSPADVERLQQANQTRHSPPSSAEVPLPPDNMMQKFATRPPTDAYRKSWQKGDRRSGQQSQPQQLRDIVTTYVQDVDPVSGQNLWYQERRRKTSTGETEVLGRQLVQGGRI